ncbi:MAG: response regulator [Pseudanabaenales cyanobacterium]|nr:response regulator [Pseudanabaenales cyanobacterium]
MVTALIVEDSLTDRERLTHYLQQSGITVLGVQSSEEALLEIQAKLPDMVFLDVVLPGQSGFEFCRDLKTNKKTQDIPIVLCSNKSTEADKLWGSMLGADAYLSKPVDQQQLAEAIQQVIG